MIPGGAPPALSAPTPALAPPPPNAAPGVTLNPGWNEVFPLTVPQNDGSPQPMGALGFGDVGPRIGMLLSASSTMPASRPQPVWSSQPTQRALAAGAGGFVAFVVFSWVSSAVRSLLFDLTYKTDAYFLMDIYRSVAPLLVLLAAAVVAALVFWLSKRFIRPIPAGPTLFCRMVGAEGFAVCRRDPARDTLSIVRFDEASMIEERSKTTTTVKNQYGRVLRVEHKESLLARWENAAGQNVHVTSATGASLAGHPDAVFHAAAEKAYLKAKAERVLGAVQGPGWTFQLRGLPGHIFVSQARLDFVVGQTAFSVAPRDLGQVAINQGRLTFSFRNGSPLTLSLSQVLDAKLLLISLDMLGVAVA